MPNPTPDFVQVRLSSAGQQLAGVGELRVSNGRRTFAFQGDGAQKIEKSFDWRGVLSRKFTASGDPLFEIVPDATAAQQPAAAASVPAAQPDAAK